MGLAIHQLIILGKEKLGNIFKAMTEKSDHKRIIISNEYRNFDFWKLIPIFKQAAIDQDFEGFDIEKELGTVTRSDYRRLRTLVKKYTRWVDLS